MRTTRWAARRSITSSTIVSRPKKIDHSSGSKGRSPDRAVSAGPPRRAFRVSALALRASRTRPVNSFQPGTELVWPIRRPRSKRSMPNAETSIGRGSPDRSSTAHGSGVPRADWMRSRSSTPISRRSPMKPSLASPRTSASASHRLAVSKRVFASRVQPESVSPESSRCLTERC